MSSVLQAWVTSMPWKCQSILLSGLRGTDGRQPPAIKAVSRWLRTISQHNADPSKGYMRPDTLPDEMTLCGELEYETCHFVHHFADALRCVAIWHPEQSVQAQAWAYHYRVAEELFHFVPETDDVFKERHRDMVTHETEARVGIGPKEEQVRQQIRDVRGGTETGREQRHGADQVASIEAPEQSEDAEPLAEQSDYGNNPRPTQNSAAGN